MTIHDYLDIQQDDLPCYCRVSNVSKDYALNHGEKCIVVDIVVELLFKDIYPHTQELSEYIEKNKNTCIRRALADDGKLYDFAIKE